MIAFMKKFGSIISNINSNYDYYDKTNLIINAFVNSAGYQYIGRADLKDFIRGNFGAIYNIYLKTLIDVLITNSEFCGACNILIGEAERKIMSYIADEVFSEENNYYYSLGQYMMSKMISDILVELQLTINDKLEAIKGITVIADIVSILGMVAGGISKTGVTLSIPSVVQAGGTAVLGGSAVVLSAEAVVAVAIAVSEVIIVSSLAVGEVALVFCSANENASIQVENSNGAIKKISESGSTSKYLEQLDNLSENKINHMINGSKNSNHGWENLVPDKNWSDIKNIIANVMDTGVEGPYKSVFSKKATINGFEVEVTYTKLSDGTIKISDAWVNQ